MPEPPSDYVPEPPCHSEGAEGESGNLGRKDNGELHSTRGGDPALRERLIPGELTHNVK